MFLRSYIQPANPSNGLSKHVHDQNTPNISPSRPLDLNSKDNSGWCFVKWETNKHAHNTKNVVIRGTMASMNKKNS